MIVILLKIFSFFQVFQLDGDAILNAQLNPASAQSVAHGNTQGQNPHTQSPASTGFTIVSFHFIKFFLRYLFFFNGLKKVSKDHSVKDLIFENDAQIDIGAKSWRTEVILKCYV